MLSSSKIAFECSGDPNTKSPNSEIVVIQFSEVFRKIGLFVLMLTAIGKLNIES